MTIDERLEYMMEATLNLSEEKREQMRAARENFNVLLRTLKDDYYEPALAIIKKAKSAGSVSPKKYADDEDLLDTYYNDAVQMIHDKKTAAAADRAIRVFNTKVSRLQSYKAGKKLG